MPFQATTLNLVADGEVMVAPDMATITVGVQTQATTAAKALTDGFDLQFGVGAAFCLVGVVAAAVLLRPQRGHQPTGAMAEAEST